MRRQAKNVEVTTHAAELLCRTALERVGASTDVAARVARVLVRNEQRGLASHGLLRLDDYVAEVAAGVIRVAAFPSVTTLSSLVRVVDGERGFGVLAADAVANEICDMLTVHDIAAVALVNSNHIGALRDIGESVTDRGSIVLGFVNYLGAGQRVVPWKGPQGRLCTNPILFAMPAGRGPAFVLDMATSTVAEGKIRARFLAGRAVPRGWLVDDGWRVVTDSARLYADPPTAFMTPLGADQGYKGFGLALAVELLAGVVTGAGFVVPHPVTGGNGGLFIGLRPTLMGRSLTALAADADALRHHTTTSDGRSSGMRWPGQHTEQVDSRMLRVDIRVWRALKRAAGTMTPAVGE